MKCHSCGRENREGATFCKYCGEGLLSCRSCGAPIKKESKFCTACGAPNDVIKADPKAELTASASASVMAANAGDSSTQPASFRADEHSPAQVDIEDATLLAQETDKADSVGHAVSVSNKQDDREVFLEQPTRELPVTPVGDSSKETEKADQNSSSTVDLPGEDVALVPEPSKEASEEITPESEEPAPAVLPSRVGEITETVFRDSETASPVDTHTSVQQPDSKHLKLAPLVAGLVVAIAGAAAWWFWPSEKTEAAGSQVADAVAASTGAQTGTAVDASSANSGAAALPASAPSVEQPTVSSDPVASVPAAAPSTSQDSGGSKPPEAPKDSQANKSVPVAKPVPKPKQDRTKPEKASASPAEVNQAPGPEVSEPVPAPVVQEDPLAPLRKALGVCNAEPSFFARTACVVKARHTYCGNHWGKTPDCPANTKTYSDN